MCGFVGFLGGIASQGSQSDEVLLKRMADTIVHRGPDDAEGKGARVNFRFKHEFTLAHLLFHLLFLWPFCFASGFKQIFTLAPLLVSYQNLGTAVRFKAQILPVLLIVLWWPFWARKVVKSKSRQMVEVRGDARL